MTHRYSLIVQSPIISNYRIARRKFSRDEKFAKSLKTGFSRLFVREMNALPIETPQSIILLINGALKVHDYISRRLYILLMKFVKISSLENYRLYGT